MHIEQGEMSWSATEFQSGINFSKQAPYKAPFLKTPIIHAAICGFTSADPSKMVNIWVDASTDRDQITLTPALVGSSNPFNLYALGVRWIAIEDTD